jgi:hypothetical protein
MTNETQLDKKIYTLGELRRMTSVELRAQSTWNANELVRLRASIELRKRADRLPVNLRRIAPR